MSPSPQSHEPPGTHLKTNRRTPAKPDRLELAPTTPPEAKISTEKARSWAYAEDLAIDDDAMLAARGRASEFGAHAISAGAGAALTVLAATLRARSVVEVGTGSGISALYALRGMAPDGILTTIDVEVEHQRAAKATFREAGIPVARTRTISGQPREVLPRLTDAAYDLMIVGGEPLDLADYAAAAYRLLRVGGALVVTRALWNDLVSDPARRDESTVAVRDFTAALHDDERYHTALLPVGDGLLVAVKR